MAAFKLIANPYIVGNPIKTTDMFYGRQSDFEFLKRKLDSAAESYVVVLCGERRSGKTSILFQILNGRLGDHFLPVLIDMQTMAGLQNENQFFDKVASEIFKSLPDTQGMASHFPFSDLQNNPYQLFDKLIDALNSKYEGKNLIFLIDEYELIDAKIEEGSLKVNFIRYLAGLLESGRRLSFVMTGSEQLDQREAEHWNILFGKALYRNVSYLQEVDAYRLVTEPVKDSLKYSKDVLRKVYRLTAGQPFYTQVFCQNMVDYANEHQKTEIAVDDFEAVVGEILENPLPQMIYFWNSQNDNRKLILAMLAEVLEDENDLIHPDLLRKTSRKQEGQFGFHASLQSIIATLEALYKEEVIKKEDGLYAFQPDLYRRWIKRDHSIYKVMKEVGKSLADDIRTTVSVSTSSKNSSSVIIPSVNGGFPKWLIGVVGVVVLAAAAYFLWPASTESDTTSPINNDPPALVENNNPVENDNNANGNAGTTDNNTSQPEIKESDPPPPVKENVTEDPEPAKPDPAIGRASEARRQMLSAKRSAESAGASSMPSFANGRRSENTGNSRQNSGNYSGAARSFADAERLYRNARSEKQQQDQERSAALSARQSMQNTQSGTANISGGDAAATLREAQNKADEGERFLASGNYSGARKHFDDARNLFAKAASEAKNVEKKVDMTGVQTLQIEIQQVKSDMTGVNYSDLVEYQQASSAEEQAVSAITAGNIPSAEQSLQKALSGYQSAKETRRNQIADIRNVVEQYRSAIQGKSVARMKRQWDRFPGDMEKQWSRVFKSVNDLEVDMNTQQIHFRKGSEATADVDVRLNFTGASGGGEWNRWEMIMRDAGSGWRISDIKQSE